MSITLKGYSSIVHFSKWCLINGCVTHRFPSLCHLKSGTTTSFFYFLNISGLFLLLAPLAKPSHNYVPFYQLPRLLLQCALSQTKQNNFAHCCPFYRTLSYIRTYGSFLIHCDTSTSLIYKLTIKYKLLPHRFPLSKELDYADSISMGGMENICPVYIYQCICTKKSTRILERRSGGGVGEGKGCLGTMP